MSANSRATLVMRAVGKGRSALQTFSGVMGMLPLVSAQAYTSHSKKILGSFKGTVSQLCWYCCRTSWSARDDELVDVKVTCDGTWSKQGFMALYGVVVLASWDRVKFFHDNCATTK